MIKKMILEAKNIRPSREGFEVAGIFNPAVIRCGKETIMLARVAESAVQNDPDYFLVPVASAQGTIEIVRLPKNDPAYDYSDKRLVRNCQHTYLTSISHLRVARSMDGEHFVFDESGIILPGGIYERFGIEDPRITKIGSTYYVTFTAVSECGINVGLMATKDFRHFRRLGNILHSDNKDCVIFPKKIGGKYLALHRPSTSEFGKLDIWTAESPNLIDWGNHKIMTSARIDYLPCSRVGAGAVPMATAKGWLVVYHSADAANRYHLTAMLLDKNDPNIVLMRSKHPLVEPTETYEKKGFVDQVVFTCGLVADADQLCIYYGVCDQNIAMCTIPIRDVWDNMEAIGA